MSREIKFRAWDKRNKVWWTSYASGNALVLNDPNVEFQQFTGLRDKNGVEIYEGDIVKGYISHSNGTEVVKYEDGGFSPFAIPRWEVTPGPTDVEVIGNIWENPDLLKGAA